MELVSAIKMKKSQQKAIEGKTYRNLLSFIIEKIIASGIDKSYSLLLSSVNSQIEKEAVILISSNKGLCGGFNFNLFRFLVKEVNFNKTDFITIGAKGAIFIKKMGGRVIADFSSLYQEDRVSAVFKTVLDLFLKGNYGRVYLIYNRFLTAIKSEPIKKQILPISVDQNKFQLQDNKTIIGEYLVEPSPEKIFDSVLRSLVEEQIREALIDSEAAEHSARMMAMKNATNNAQDVIYNLTLLRNRVRQEKITYELLDMVTAKESVE